jgi:hypothetical protein
MIPIPPEQTQALRIVLSASGPKVTSALGIDQPSVDQFIAKAGVLVAGTTHIQPDQRYSLALSTTSGAGAPITPLVLRQHLQAGNRLVRLDSSFRLVEAVSLPVLLPDATERTTAENSFEIVVHDKQMYHMLMGRLINEMTAGISSTARPASRWPRPFSDIEGLLKDHVDNYIAREQATRYWFDKAQRILLTGPDGTEYIFQNALYWWLRHYVSDSIDVYAEPTKHGQDKTDIVVTTFDGKYVIEVKWLGKNQKNTKYGEGRIQEGIAQVAIYLNNDEKLIWGHLIIYDARVADEHQNKRSYDKTQQHIRCSEPRLIYLENESPTQLVQQRQRAVRKKRTA